MTSERRATLIAETSNRRPGTPADIAAVVMFLASPTASRITGQVLHVNGAPGLAGSSRPGAAGLDDSGRAAGLAEYLGQRLLDLLRQPRSRVRRNRATMRDEPAGGRRRLPNGAALTALDLAQAADQVHA